MSAKTKSAIAYSGIVLTLVYFLVVAGYFITKSIFIFKCWEAIIILSGPVILIILLAVLEHTNENKQSMKIAAIVFITCTTAITAAAHYANIVSRTEVIAELQANDPLAWGFFMGLAFVFTSIALPAEPSKLKKIKYTSMICGILCFLGLLGPFLDIDALWFIAVAGYGLGTPVICLQLLSLLKNQP